MSLHPRRMSSMYSVPCFCRSPSRFGNLLVIASRCLDRSLSDEECSVRGLVPELRHTRTQRADARWIGSIEKWRWPTTRYIGRRPEGCREATVARLHPCVALSTISHASQTMRPFCRSSKPSWLESTKAPRSSVDDSAGLFWTRECSESLTLGPAR